MDPKNTVEMLKYLEKQNELLLEAKDKMTHELHKLQVEEKMLMRKFYEMTTALGLNKKDEVIWKSPGFESCLRCNRVPGAKNLYHACENEVSGLISNEAEDGGVSNALTNVPTEGQ